MPITPEQLGVPDVGESVTRLKERSGRLRKVQRKIAQGRGHEADSHERRLKAALRRMELEDDADMQLVAGPDLGLQAHIGARNNMLSAEFLEIGILTARAVCKISRGVTTGTGFLIGEGILMTNFHVIKTKKQAQESLFEFSYEDNTIGAPRIAAPYVGDPDKFFLIDKALDLCMVALKHVTGSPKLGSFGWLPLFGGEGKALIGDPVNIIQHPRGHPRRVVVHESALMMVDADPVPSAFCWYTGDTDEGSSGAPVLNAQWETVALHHRAVPATNKNGHVLDINGKTIAETRVGNPELKVKWIANEGVRVSSIVTHLSEVKLTKKYGVVRDKLLKLWDNPAAAIVARKAALKGITS